MVTDVQQGINRSRWVVPIDALKWVAVLGCAYRHRTTHRRRSGGDRPRSRRLVYSDTLTPSCHMHLTMSPRRRRKTMSPHSGRTRDSPAPAPPMCSAPGNMSVTRPPTQPNTARNRNHGRPTNASTGASTTTWTNPAQESGDGRLGRVYEWSIAVRQVPGDNLLHLSACARVPVRLTLGSQYAAP